MTRRCSYIPPEGQSVIAIAKERGGTTNGDIQALVDRFGCKAEATHEVAIGDADEPDKLLDACRDHVGHLLGDGGCWVAPIVPIEVAMTIAFGPPISGDAVREDFGLPTLLAPKAWSNASPEDILRDITTAAPVVDLGANPTRGQSQAAGFSYDSAAYRMPTPRSGWGESVLSRALPAIRSAAQSEIVLSSGNLPLTLRPTRVTPGHDGDAATLRITAEPTRAQLDVLEDWYRTRVPVRVDPASAPYVIATMAYTGSADNGWHLTFTLKQIQLGGMSVQQRAKMEQAMRTGVAAYPPYRGEEVGAMVGHLPPPPAAKHASLALHHAVASAMLRLHSYVGKIPATDEGYAMVRAEVAKCLGVHWDTVEVDPQPPGFGVKWNGVGVLCR